MNRRFESIDWKVTMGQSRPQIPHGHEVREHRLESHRGIIEASDTPWRSRTSGYLRGIKHMERRFESIDWRVTMGQSRAQIPHGHEVRDHFNNINKLYIIEIFY